MPFGGANIVNDQRSFPPILRLLDEFDQYSRSTDRSSRGNSISNSFTPKFDIKENHDAYNLYGEFPGIDQKDIDIEFTNASTLIIKGHVERNYNADEKSPAKKIFRVTVEDEEDEDSSKTKVVQPKASPKEQTEKFWVTERSVGDFSRTFAFPVHVDQDRVKASMKNGILNIFVPKAKKNPGRKIVIQ